LHIDDGWRDGLPVLAGKLVTVREIAFEDVPSLHVLIASDPRVTEYISPPPPSIVALQGFVAWAHDERAAGRLVCYAVVPHGLRYAVGVFQIKKLQPGFTVAEWGFALGSSFWGTGMFEDAAVLVADFAFDTLGVHRLEGRAVTANGRANGALTKIGAKGEAVLREGLRRGSVFMTQYLWTLTSAEWQQQHSALRTRFSPADVENHILAAINEANQQLTAAAPSSNSPIDSIARHPFVIWGGLDGHSKD
jgi:ribosomal-protein-alanine N-acetyltransferase